jgi:hypothetical protein
VLQQKRRSNDSFVIVNFFVALQQNKKKKATIALLQLASLLRYNKTKEEGNDSFVVVSFFVALQQNKKKKATKKMKKKGIREGAYLKQELWVPCGSYFRHRSFKFERAGSAPLARAPTAPELWQWSERKIKWEVGKKFGAEKRLKKINNFGQGDVFLVHPENSFNGLIPNWCNGGCWFTPASFRQLSIGDHLSKAQSIKPEAFKVLLVRIVCVSCVFLFFVRH